MAELKTKPNSDSVVDFLNGLSDEQKRWDSFTVLALMQEAAGAEAQLWGSSVVGLAVITIAMLVVEKVSGFWPAFRPASKI
ncbi:MAG: hypothetical protein U0401_08000 [Anaerolineae bacterium]